MSKKVSDARDAIEIAKDYAKRSMGAMFWRDVISCELDKKTGEWIVVFEASPGFPPTQNFSAFSKQRSE